MQDINQISLTTPSAGLEALKGSTKLAVINVIIANLKSSGFLLLFWDSYNCKLDNKTVKTLAYDVNRALTDGNKKAIKLYFGKVKPFVDEIVKEIVELLSAPIRLRQKSLYEKEYAELGELLFTFMVVDKLSKQDLIDEISWRETQIKREVAIEVDERIRLNVAKNKFIDAINHNYFNY